VALKTQVLRGNPGGQMAAFRSPGWSFCIQRLPEPSLHASQAIIELVDKIRLTTFTISRVHWHEQARTLWATTHCAMLVTQIYASPSCPSARACASISAGQLSVGTATSLIGPGPLPLRVSAQKPKVWQPPRQSTDQSHLGASCISLFCCLPSLCKDGHLELPARTCAGNV
jgi:hypothetical protein